MWREGKGGGKNDLLTTQDEFDAAQDNIRANEDDYTATQIKDNIHSSPNEGPSSQGCQVVPVEEGYAEMIAEVQEMNSEEKRGAEGTVLYTLIDASKVDLSLEKSVDITL